MIDYLKQLAIQAGAIALSEQLQMSHSNVHAKGTIRDLVTDTDRHVETFIVDALQRQFPECGIFGEESGKNHADREYCFVIDPIDGTTSFIHRLPNWCISIGLVHNGRSVKGVVYQPTTGDLFYAEEGKGSYCNGVRLHVSVNDRIEDCVVATGFSCLRAHWCEENNLRFFDRIAPDVSDIRKYGSAALDCCQVANGSLDTYWELFLQPYDIAAGCVILTEAGGKITDFKGGNDFPEYGFLATNNLIHTKMLQYFTDYKHLKR